MAKSKERITFVIQKGNEGLIEKLIKLADNNDRKLNDFLNIHFAKLTKNVKL